MRKRWEILFVLLLVTVAAASAAGTWRAEAKAPMPAGGPWLPPGQDFYCDVASDGQNCLVVWENESFSNRDANVYGVRVDPSGRVLDPCGIPISAGERGQRLPRVAFDGSTYVVVWIDSRNGNWDIYGARVSVAGEVLDPQGIAISTAPWDETSVDVASSARGSLVVWCGREGDGTDIYAARIDGSGKVLDPGDIPIATGPLGQYHPAVSSNGTDYLAVWTEYRGGAVRHDICGARVTASGSVLDSGGLTISGSEASQAWPAVASNGSAYLVVWIDERNFTVSGDDIYGARVSAAGAVLDPNGIPISTRERPQLNPAVASNGADFLALWSDRAGGSGSDIYGTRVSGSGQVLLPRDFSVSTAYSNQGRPAAAFGGANYFCAWDDLRSGTDSDIFGARVSSAGTVLDAAGIQIPGPGSQALAAVDVAPDPLNVKSRGRWITCYIELTVGRVVDIDVASVRLNGSVRAEVTKWELGDYDEDGNPDLMIKFDRTAACGALTAGHDVPVTITGNVACVTFSGTDYIDVIHPPAMLPEDDPSSPAVDAISISVTPAASGSRANIVFSMIDPGRVVLRVYNIAGRCIRTVVDAQRQPGVYTELWDGKADDGSTPPSGVYFCRLEAGDFVATQKMVLLR